MSRALSGTGTARAGSGPLPGSGRRAPGTGTPRPRRSPDGRAHPSPRRRRGRRGPPGPCPGRAGLPARSRDEPHTGPGGRVAGRVETRPHPEHHATSHEQPRPGRGARPAFASLCAHHLLPFFGTCTLAYRPAGRIAGLGWFPRLVSALSRRPQLQERLADQLAQALTDALAPRSVGVHLVARQLCVELRGPRTSASFEVTALRGEDDPALTASLT